MSGFLNTGRMKLEMLGERETFSPEGDTVFEGFSEGI
jgi:hypothetical protein